MLGGTPPSAGGRARLGGETWMGSCASLSGSSLRFLHAQPRRNSTTSGQMARADATRMLELVGMLYKLSGVAYTFEADSTFRVDKQATVDELERAVEGRFLELSAEYGGPLGVKIRCVRNGKHPSKVLLSGKVAEHFVDGDPILVCGHCRPTDSHADREKLDSISLRRGSPRKEGPQTSEAAAPSSHQRHPCEPGGGLAPDSAGVLEPQALQGEAPAARPVSPCQTSRQKRKRGDKGGRVVAASRWFII